MNAWIIAHTAVVRLLWVIAARAQWIAHGILCWCRWHHWCCYKHYLPTYHIYHHHHPRIFARDDPISWRTHTRAHKQQFSHKKRKRRRREKNRLAWYSTHCLIIEGMINAIWLIISVCTSTAGRAAHGIWWGAGRLLSRIQIGLLLSFTNIFLIANAFIAKPIGHLGYL